MSSATTHMDLVMRAKEERIEVQSIHNASIMNAIGCCGLQLYSYGQTISIVFFTDSWRPDSFYAKIKQNRDLGLHTLCLLDIKIKEQSMENMARFESNSCYMGIFMLKLLDSICCSEDERFTNRLVT